MELTIDTDKIAEMIKGIKEWIKRKLQHTKHTQD